ncbi:MAG TPA: efflux transporter outer membrane subunit [Bryobacteraceae bacterium]|nr:efflux transporter outer membrane subunit [Bryobacteraceae bacterium]
MQTLRRNSLAAAVIAGLAFSSACAVGPKYAKPSVPAPPGYHEQLPEYFKETPGWKASQPSDQVSKGNWWEIFKDPQLNALEQQVSVSNLTIAQDEAVYRESRALVQEARAGLYPTVTGSIGVTGSRSSADRGAFPFSTPPSADIPLTGAVSWVPDLWGQIRKEIAQSVSNAQVSAAQLENARLSLQAELALDYFGLRGQDRERRLLDDTVTAYQRALELTRDRFAQGVASRLDVTQAQTQLETTRAQATDTDVQRAAYEHAIAVLIGKPPAEFSIPRTPLEEPPPPIPGALPSQLLERRPDIAAAERQVAAANQQIGIAITAFYPTVTLSASAGFEGSTLVNWLTWPSRFFSIGPTLSELFYDAGRRKAVTAEARAAYDATVANYRQTVLTAFQQVEDNLAGLRILQQEAGQEDAAVKAAEDSLSLSLVQYRGGVTSYLQVITAQEAALQNESTAVSLLTRRVTSSVSLIQALGGSWNVAQLPTADQITAANPAPASGKGAVASTR